MRGSTEGEDSPGKQRIAKASRTQRSQNLFRVFGTTPKNRDVAGDIVVDFPPSLPAHESRQKREPFEVAQIEFQMSESTTEGFDVTARLPVLVDSPIDPGKTND